MLGAILVFLVSSSLIEMILPDRLIVVVRLLQSEGLNSLLENMPILVVLVSGILCL